MSSTLSDFVDPIMPAGQRLQRCFEFVREGSFVHGWYHGKESKTGQSFRGLWMQYLDG